MSTKNQSIKHHLAIAISAGLLSCAASSWAAERTLLSEAFSSGSLEGAGFYSLVLESADGESQMGPEALWRRVQTLGGLADNGLSKARNTQLVVSFDAVDLPKPGDYVELRFEFLYVGIVGDAGSGLVVGLFQFPEPITGHVSVKHDEAHPWGGARGVVLGQQPMTKAARLGLDEFKKVGWGLNHLVQEITEPVSSINIDEEQPIEQLLPMTLRLTRTDNGFELTGTHNGDELNPLMLTESELGDFKPNAFLISAQGVGGKRALLDAIEIVTNTDG